MDPAPYYLPLPYSKGLGISTPDKDKSLSGTFKRFSFASFGDQKPSRLSLDSPSVHHQAPSDKVIGQMTTSSKKMLDKIEEIDNNMAKNKLPFLKYYLPGTETFKSKKEITREIQTSYDFFQADTSLFKSSKYKPKDFLYASPRSKSKTLVSPKQRTPCSEYKFEMPVCAENQEVQANAPTQASPSHLSPLRMRELNFQKKTTFGDEYEAKFSPNLSSAHYTSLDTAPSIFHMQPVEKVQIETEEMVLVRYNKDKIPLNLYESTVKRKNLMKEIKGSNAKTLEKQVSLVVKKDVKKDDIKPMTASAAFREERRKNSEEKEKEKRFGKADMVTRSPVSNVYYQVLSMSSPRRKLMAEKLKLTLPEKSCKPTTAGTRIIKVSSP